MRSPTSPTHLPRGIQRLADGSFRCEVRIRPLPLRRKRFPPDTPIGELKEWCDEARHELRKERKQILQGLRPAPAAVGQSAMAAIPHLSTLADDVKVYLKSYLNTVHHSTRTNRERYLKAWIQKFGKRRRQTITTQEIVAALNDFQRCGIVRHRPLAPETVNQVRLALLRLYECLNADHEINPVKRVPLARVDKPAARGMTYDVVEAILAKLPHRTATAARCRLMAYTGMRPVEIMRIRPQEDWNRADQTLLIRTAKGGMSARIQLLPQATAALAELDRLHAWGDYWAAPVSRAFAEARKAAGYEAIAFVPYDLRHCYGTLIYEQTGDLKAVKEALRHSTLRLSERYMAAAVSPMLEKVHDKLSAYFADRDTAQRKAQAKEKRTGFKIVQARSSTTQPSRTS